MTPSRRHPVGCPEPSRIRPSAPGSTSFGLPHRPVNSQPAGHRIYVCCSDACSVVENDITESPSRTNGAASGHRGRKAGTRVGRHISFSDRNEARLARPWIRRLGGAGGPLAWASFASSVLSRTVSVGRFSASEHAKPGRLQASGSLCSSVRVTPFCGGGGEEEGLFISVSARMVRWTRRRWLATDETDGLGESGLISPTTDANLGSLKLLTLCPSDYPLNHNP